MVHDRATYGWKPQQLEGVTRQILHDIKIINRVLYQPMVRFWIASEEGNQKFKYYLGLIVGVNRLLGEIKTYLSSAGSELLICVSLWKDNIVTT